ncbi:hypothetical protein F5890DRAFT_1517462 [Lentinula detonsa]|uniref:Uncharacterized protein n=1 Tax=Lentinula detonsa TaxID=2804962 RepID=A0AA38URS1_9AGAR|nr:hypothetical protein F5890DRAFT_1517462 [Lentinula detonsa]
MRLGRCILDSCLPHMVLTLTTYTLHPNEHTHHPHTTLLIALSSGSVFLQLARHSCVFSCRGKQVFALSLFRPSNDFFFFFQPAIHTNKLSLLSCFRRPSRSAPSPITPPTPPTPTSSYPMTHLIAIYPNSPIPTTQTLLNSTRERQEVAEMLFYRDMYIFDGAFWNWVCRCHYLHSGEMFVIHNDFDWCSGTFEIVFNALNIASNSLSCILWCSLKGS